ncbi:hypothetical protein RF11_08946 [Thelohanellus kitauei]|uniref:Uncharacterized protein n=1 Tax=Thelohanellus kitauei TaxID=669202 RepID=A0A0C2M6W2_THEKT|nr:hypothetical protein RF11_08946 [Thelohanellus kitauei]
MLGQKSKKITSATFLNCFDSANSQKSGRETMVWVNVKSIVRESMQRSSENVCGNFLPSDITLVSLKHMVLKCNHYTLNSINVPDCNNKIICQILNENNFPDRLPNGESFNDQKR